jgi:hypothetical protein
MQKITARVESWTSAWAGFAATQTGRSERPTSSTWGAGGGFFNMMPLFPELKAGVVVMGNATSYDHQRIARAARSTPRRHGKQRPVAGAARG